jgi:hypothetical protein
MRPAARENHSTGDHPSDQNFSPCHVSPESSARERLAALSGYRFARSKSTEVATPAGRYSHERSIKALTNYSPALEILPIKRVDADDLRFKSAKG